MTVRILALTLLWALALAACTPSGSPPAPTYAPPTPAVLQTAPPPATQPPPTATAAPPTIPPPVCIDTRGRVESRAYYSQVLQREMPYRIYLPPCYSTDDPAYPALYLLHGYPYDESHWDQLGADETADIGIRSGAYPDFVIVMPNCDPTPDGIFVNTSGGDNSVEGLVARDLIPHIDATYHTRAEREGRAIGGISRGGVWSLEIGFRRPDLFGIVGGHSPALSVNLAHPVYDPLNLARDPSIASLRIWLDAGDVDWAQGGAQELHRVLEANGVAHEYVVGEGPHEDEYWARMLPAYLAFYTASWQAAAP